MHAPSTSPPRRGSFLDRLLQVTESPAAGKRATTTASLVADLEALLNAWCALQFTPHDFPEVAASIVAYGASPPWGDDLASPAQRRALARHFERQLTLFEPRLRELRVRILAPDADPLRFQLEVTAEHADQSCRPFRAILRASGAQGRLQVVGESS